MKRSHNATSAQHVAFVPTTCRHCLGAKCIHCNHKGYWMKRVYRRALPQQRDETRAVMSFLTS